MIVKTVADLPNSNLAKLAKKYKKLGKKSLTIGVHKKDNKFYPEKDVTTAQVAYWLEWGTSKMRPRVWLRIFNLNEAEKGSLREQIQIAFENDDVDTALEEIGAYMADRVKDRIWSDEVYPKSKKKEGITLIDTGQLVSSIKYEVNNAK